MLIPSNNLEWAFKHIIRYYSSDFFPDPFEFEAIKTQWSTVRPILEKIDLKKYTPKTPLQTLSPKANGTFRVVHQLDPLDAILYTGLAHVVASDVELARIPLREGIACSYRIAPDVNGSFFADTPDGWEIFTKKTNELIDRFPEGSVLVCDIVDFYNQIYSHRLRNVIGELSRTDAGMLGEVIERFIECLNTQTSRGIPVGPAASIIFSEALMIDIDRKVLATTRDYVRWVDDFRIFFPSHEDARKFLHDFTAYLHDNHRLVLSAEKTKITTVQDFKTSHALNDAEREARFFEAKAQSLALEQHYKDLIGDAGPYAELEFELDEEQFEQILEAFRKDRGFEIASAAYSELLHEEIGKETPDFVLIRRILRNAKKYRIRSILTDVLNNFDRLIPLTREVCLYLERVVNSKVAEDNETAILAVAESSAATIPYVNMWLAWLFSSAGFCDKRFAILGTKIKGLRQQALFAAKTRDLAWVKSHKNGLDTLGPYEKRAVLYASQILSTDERKVWLGIAKERGDLLERVLADHLLSKQ